MSGIRIVKVENVLNRIRGTRPRSSSSSSSELVSIATPFFVVSTSSSLNISFILFGSLISTTDTLGMDFWQEELLDENQLRLNGANPLSQPDGNLERRSFHGPLRKSKIEETLMNANRQCIRLLARPVCRPRMAVRYAASFVPQLSSRSTNFRR